MPIMYWAGPQSTLGMRPAPYSQESQGYPCGRPVSSHITFRFICWFPKPSVTQARCASPGRHRPAHHAHSSAKCCEQEWLPPVQCCAETAPRSTLYGSWKASRALSTQSWHKWFEVTITSPFYRENWREFTQPHNWWRGQQVSSPGPLLQSSTHSLAPLPVAPSPWRALAI